MNDTGWRLRKGCLSNVIEKFTFPLVSEVSKIYPRIKEACLDKEDPRFKKENERKGLGKHNILIVTCMCNIHNKFLFKHSWVLYK